MNRRHRRRNMNPDLEKRIVDMAGLGYSGKEIFDKMSSWDEWEPEKPVGLRTVQSVVHEVQKRDLSGPWSMADQGKDGSFVYSPEDARIVLDVWADLVAAFARKRAFTREEAKWVLRIRKLAPDLHAWHVWDLALSYMTLQKKEFSTEGLDAYLAFRPWASKNRCENYGNALREGLVKDDPQASFRWRKDKFSWDFGIPRKLITQVERDYSTMAEQMHDMATSEIRKAQEDRKMQLIREQDPALAQKIDEALNDAISQATQVVARLDRRPGKEEFTQERRQEFFEEFKSAFAEYRALVDSFVEVRRKGRRKTATTRPDNPIRKEAK